MREDRLNKRFRNLAPRPNKMRQYFSCILACILFVSPLFYLSRKGWSCDFQHMAHLSRRILADTSTPPRRTACISSPYFRCPPLSHFHRKTTLTYSITFLCTSSRQSGSAWSHGETLKATHETQARHPRLPSLYPSPSTTYGTHPTQRQATMTRGVRG